MTVNSRILTCSFNRRRLRISPQHLDDSTVQTIKPQQNPLKSREDAQNNFRTMSENLPTGSSVEKESRTPSLEMESEALSQPSIFRRISSLRDQEESDADMFVLKRANPIYESDEEDYETSPPKRHRAVGPTVLHWDDQLSISESHGFTF